MAKAEVVPATPEHAEELALTMREADVAELWASSLCEPREALINGIKCSDQAMTGLLDGEVACMFGVTPTSMLGGNGIVWMLGSDLIEQHPKHFLRRCRAEVAVMARNYDVLHNWVDDRNVKSIRWLRWLGFTVESPQARGAAGLPFRYFYKRT